MQIFSSEQAFENLDSNRFADWPASRSEINRLEPRCQPGFSPSFELSPGEKVFTMGSCFARNVENALAAQGFDVVTRNIARVGAEFADFGPNILNNYGVPSIFNELDWALNKQNYNESANFFEVAPDRFVDIHLPLAIRPATIDVVRRRRAAIMAVTRQVADCSVVIMTLGLTEVWFDTLTRRYLNYAPSKMLCARYPARFEVHVLDFKTAYDFIKSIITILNNNCRPDLKIILTVSPAPATRTFTSNDIIVANCYSKSLLRVISEAIALEYKHVDYYPSYESVTLTERAAAWRDDMHHVETELVRINVARMVEAYTSNSAKSDGDVDEAFLRAKEYSEARDPIAAIRCLEPFASRLSDEAMLLFYAELCSRVGRRDKALSVLRALPSEAGGWRRTLSEARILLAEGQFEQALSKVLGVIEKLPKSALAWQILAEIRFAGEMWVEATVATKRWADLNVRSGEPLRMLAEIYRKQGKLAEAKQAYASGVERQIVSSKLTLDYAEFLLDQGELDEARRILEVVMPDSRAARERIEKLSLFVK
ncbi:MAG TPA: GSCFA domain-containing protein [Rhodoblastus sp.]|nr:GSCFA domain-containing protein [Rhodoblastus sp.]